MYFGYAFETLRPLTDEEVAEAQALYDTEFVLNDERSILFCLNYFEEGFEIVATPIELTLKGLAGKVKVSSAKQVLFGDYVAEVHEELDTFARLKRLTLEQYHEFLNDGSLDWESLGEKE